MTPQQHLLEIQMEHAKDKLLNSNKTVELIANSVGFPNVSYFIKKFRDHFGESPKQYRTKNE